MPSDTPEQLAIFEHLATTPLPLLIDAKAGSGKTTTVISALSRGCVAGASLVLAFNKAIAEEIKARFAAASPSFLIAANTNISTVHAHGLRAFASRGKPQVQGGKLNFMLRDQVASYRDDDDARRNTRHIARLTSMAKNAGFGLKACDSRETFPSIGDKAAWEDLVEHFNLDAELEGQFKTQDLISEAITLLESSNKRLGMIDFDDMVYLPLLLDLPLPLYDNVLIDEAQDINATRRELAFRSLKRPKARIIAVGDPNQAIYGFTGASVDSLDAIRRRCDPSPPTLPLSICWRCDDAVLDEARKIVPTIRTAQHKQGKGSVWKVPFRSEPDGKGYAGEDFLALPAPGDAILCRLNKPNVATCLGLLRRGTPARIEGRDLGAKLLGHVKKASESWAFSPISDSIGDLESYLQLETAKLISKQRESAIGMLEDEVGAAQLLIERVVETKGPKARFTDLEALTATLFADDVQKHSTVTLASVHKAKGREWRRVFILGRYDYMPFHRATLPWEEVQEQNLIYVAVTRAEAELYYVTGVQAAIDAGLHRLPALGASAGK